jgi:plasmid stabilization system protein ParE
MKLRWTGKAIDDAGRVYGFLARLNPEAAQNALEQISITVSRLPNQPRIGMRLTDYAPREVRRIIVGRYEVRYEIAAGEIIVLRLWHGREERR